jgi:alpha-D-xyloside xylohydrolase
VPWAFDDESVEVVRFFTHLKCKLMPYLYAAACEASRTGVPLLRHMMLEFPDDPAWACLDRQYMLGHALLVAPVFNAEGIAEYYLPEGEWVHLLSGRVEKGGRWIRESIGYSDIPIYQRQNTIVPFGAVEDRPDYDYADNVELRVFRLSDHGDHDVTLFDTRGQVSRRFKVSRRLGKVEVAPDKTGAAWRLREC